MELAHQRRKKSLELVLVVGLGKVFCNLCHASNLSGFLEGRVYMAVLLLPAKVALDELRTRSRRTIHWSMVSSIVYKTIKYTYIQGY